MVDDEPAIRDAVVYALRREGYDVDASADGEDAIERAQAARYDLIVLDLMLPGVSGTEVCRRIRAESSVPIIMLTAKSAEVDRVVGLELGADDYVTKPFSIAELTSRVRAQLRRRELDRAEHTDSVLRVGEIRLDLLRHEVDVDGRRIVMTPTEFKLLALLATEPERPFTRREVMQHLWSSEHVGDMRACDTHVVQLRRKIEPDPRRPRRLLTVRGVGYKLVP